MSGDWSSHVAVSAALRRLPLDARACSRPCRSCSWRRDSQGRWEYPNLAEYTRATLSELEEPARQPVFECHSADDTTPWLCAGWLAVAGSEHPDVVQAVTTGLLDERSLTTEPTWPPLFATTQAMLDAHRSAAAEKQESGSGS